MASAHPTFYHTTDGATGSNAARLRIGDGTGTVDTVISGNQGAGVLCAGTALLVVHTLIGLGADGSKNVGNSFDGYGALLSLANPPWQPISALPCQPPMATNFFSPLPTPHGNQSDVSCCILRCDLALPLTLTLTLPCKSLLLLSLTLKDHIVRHSVLCDDWTGGWPGECHRWQRWRWDPDCGHLHQDIEHVRNPYPLLLTLTPYPLPLTLTETHCIPGSNSH
jgi:hypothetical protein